MKPVHAIRGQRAANADAADAERACVPQRRCPCADQGEIRRPRMHRLAIGGWPSLLPGAVRYCFPLKFEVFTDTELSLTSAVKSFTVYKSDSLRHRVRLMRSELLHRQHRSAIRHHRRSVHSELADAEGRRCLLQGHDDHPGRLVAGGLLQDQVTYWHIEARRRSLRASMPSPPLVWPSPCASHHRGRPSARWFRSASPSFARNTASSSAQ